MLATIIVVATFLYTVEIQPVATGDLQTMPLQETGITANLARYYGILELLLSKSPALLPWTLFKKTPTYTLNTFSSPQELQQFFKKNNANNFHYYNDYYIGAPRMVMSNSKSAETTNSFDGGVPVDFSKTNIQVEGVDEPDVVKTDGTYLYILANGKIFIIRAFPPGEATVLSKITATNNECIHTMFINNDHLIIFSAASRTPVEPQEQGSSWRNTISTTIITIYDLKDRTNPLLVKQITIDGTFFDARMIGDYVYVISSESSYNIYYEYNGNETLCVPQITINEETKKIPCNQIYYIDIPEPIDTMTHVLSVNINTNDVDQKSFLLGQGQTMYMSQNNIFLVYTKNEYIAPIIGESYGRNKETTTIHKISVNDGDISYAAQGEVPGRILNQFSMDEYNGFFRIATTIGYASKSANNIAQNNIYILDESLQQASAIEDIAPGEQIHSARFIGDRAYLVTFKKIDPFFTIDLTDPYHPKILGELKIPGYSDYLHPIDENHILGVGKDTAEPQGYYQDGTESSFAWYQGLKLAVFDVSDFEHPKELWKIIIGDRGTDSPVLSDHKAFLYDATKSLLVLPVNLCEISEEIKAQSNGYTGSNYGEFTFQGAYVYRLTIENGFEYKGRITHRTDDIQNPTTTRSWGYYGSSSDVSRSLYIGDVLYTISNSMVKMNNLATLSELNSVALQ